MTSHNDKRKMWQLLDKPVPFFLQNLILLLELFPNCIIFVHFITPKNVTSKHLESVFEHEEKQRDTRRRINDAHPLTAGAKNTNSIEEAPFAKPLLYNHLLLRGIRLMHRLFRVRLTKAVGAVYGGYRAQT